jgi:hypothetical protein
MLRRVFGPRRRQELKRGGRKVLDEHVHGSHSRFQILELRYLLFKKLSLGSTKLSSSAECSSYEGLIPRCHVVTAGR